MAAIIKQTPIIQSMGNDLLCWKLTPSGKFNPKSAYKLCLQVLQQEGEQQPRQISTSSKNLLEQVWKAKDLVPRVQTFAWRLIRKALPTGKRAGKYTIHISKLCPRCGIEEDELHILFLCHYAKTAWFSHPWYLRSENLLQNYNSISEIILSLANSGHPHASLNNIFTFLWCLWKSRNNKLFQRKEQSPMQVSCAAQAISHCLSLEELSQGRCKDNTQAGNKTQSLLQPKQGSTIDIKKIVCREQFFC